MKSEKQKTKVQKKTKLTWLWVLGWICIFPIPLTILMIRNKNLDNKVKYGIIAVAWIVYLIIAMAGNNDNSTDSNTNTDSSISTTLEAQTDNSSNDSSSETTSTEDSDSASDESIGNNNLNDFLLALTPNTSKDDIVELSEEYGLLSGGKNSNTGHYTYRFAETENVANAFKAENGSVITVTYNLLSNDEMEEITYFDESRMVAGFWTPDAGYTITDYNNPQIVSESGSSRVPVSSFAEVIDYIPEISKSDNLLEKLFLSISDTTTKADILAFVDEKNLVYDSRGKGNEQMIAYTSDVIKKYGDAGSYISFDCDSNDVITRISYYEYPYYYRTQGNAVYYSESYSHSDLVGYYLVQYKEDPIQFSDARSLIDEINLQSAGKGNDLTSATEKSDYDVIYQFISDFNSGCEHQITDTVEFEPHDKESGYYRTEFRLGAWEGSVGVHGKMGDSDIDVVLYGSHGGLYNNTDLRVYVTTFSEEEIISIFCETVRIVDSTVTDDEINGVISYVKDYGSYNGFLIGNMEPGILTSRGSYRLMFSMRDYVEKASVE